MFVLKYFLLINKPWFWLAKFWPDVILCYLWFPWSPFIMSWCVKYNYNSLLLAVISYYHYQPHNCHTLIRKHSTAAGTGTDLLKCRLLNRLVQKLTFPSLKTNKWKPMENFIMFDAWFLSDGERPTPNNNVLFTRCSWRWWDGSATYTSWYTKL